MAKSEDQKPIDKINLDSKLMGINILETSASLEENNNELYTIDEVVKFHIKKIMTSTNGNVQKAAVILGVSERTLQRRLQQMKNNPST